LSALTVLITSLSVSPDAASLAGSTRISYAGVTSPPTLAYEIPGTCWIRGMMTLSAYSESSPAEYLSEYIASVRTVDSLGSRIETVGGVMLVGSCLAAACTAFSVSDRSVAISEPST